MGCLGSPSLQRLGYHPQLLTHTVINRPAQQRLGAASTACERRHHCHWHEKSNPPSIRAGARPFQVAAIRVLEQGIPAWHLRAAASSCQEPQP